MLNDQPSASIPPVEQYHIKGQRVLDRMPRIVVDQKPDKPLLFSYHYEYKDYLDYYRFIDPERARRKEELEKRKLAK